MIVQVKAPLVFGAKARPLGCVGDTPSLQMVQGADEALCSNKGRGRLYLLPRCCSRVCASMTAETEFAEVAASASLAALTASSACPAERSPQLWRGPRRAAEATASLDAAQAALRGAEASPHAFRRRREANGARLSGREGTFGQLRGR